MSWKQSDHIYADPCEWNPVEGQPAYDNEVHARAAVIVGANGKWRLCESCAALPEFAKYRKRKKIEK
jgi:hypothetical protein